jgi:anaerobic ribonucleoside-triphosphate reductase activating protein
MNYAEIKPLDVSNSIGISCTLFVSGCTNNCEGCFNKDLQNFNYGKEWTKEVEDYFIKCCKNPHVTNVCLLGGEVFQQDIDTIADLLLRIVITVNKPIWCWTGLLYEDILKDKYEGLLPLIDILIDGRFELDKKDLSLKHRGSSNQRIINVRESLQQHKVIEYEF